MVAILTPKLRIIEVMNFSQDIRTFVENDEHESNDNWLNRCANGDSLKVLSEHEKRTIFFGLKPNHLKRNAHVPVHLPIVVFTWSPNGTYKRACLLDSLRFNVLRPPGAYEIEHLPRHVPQGGGTIPTPTGCAEWHGFIKFMSQKDHRDRKWY